MSYTASDLIEKISKEFNLSFAEAKVIFDSQFKTINRFMEEDSSIPLPLKYIGKLRKDDRQRIHIKP